MESNIRNPKQQTLFLNFYNIKCPVGRPSDIDMFYMGDKFLILGEIKNECGTFSDGQKHLYEKLAENFTKDVYILFIKHNKYVEKGDTEVDIAEALVNECYVKGEGWITPKKVTSVQEFLNKLFDFYK